MSDEATVHGSALVAGERGVLIRGPSGSGKSALLVAMLASGPANRLVADDRVGLAAHHGRLVATVPDTIAGLVELRGQGIIRYPHLSPARIHLVVDLAPAAECPRMPEAGDGHVTVAGVALPRLLLPIGATDGPLRANVALQRLTTGEW